MNFQDGLKRLHLVHCHKKGAKNMLNRMFSQISLNSNSFQSSTDVIPLNELLVITGLISFAALCYAIKVNGRFF